MQFWSRLRCCYCFPHSIVDHEPLVADHEVPSPLRISPYHREEELGLVDGLTAADVYENTQELEELLVVGLVCSHGTVAPRPSSSLPRRLDNERFAERV